MSERNTAILVIKRPSVSSISVSVIAICLYAACSSSSVSYLANYPPEIKLSKDTNNFVLLNHFDTTKLNLDKKKDSIIYACYREFVSNMTMGFAPQIRLNTSYRGTAPPRDLAAQALPKAVTTFATQNEADFVLVIESFDIKRSKSIPFGNDSEVARYLEVASVLRLYSKTGAQINRSTISKATQIDVSEADNTFEGLVTPKASIKKFASVLFPLAQDAAREYTGKFNPTEQFVTRKAFTEKPFEGFANLIHSKSYQEAESLLLPLTTNSNTSISKKAMYNMYVLREAEGKIEESKSWLSKYDKLNQ